MKGVTCSLTSVTIYHTAQPPFPGVRNVMSLLLSISRWLRCSGTEYVFLCSSSHCCH